MRIRTGKMNTGDFFTRKLNFEYLYNFEGSSIVYKLKEIIVFFINYKKILIHELLANSNLEMKQILQNEKIISRAHFSTLSMINLQRKARVLTRLGDYEKAFTATRRSMKISRKNRDLHGELESFNIMGNIYFYKGDYVNAMKYYLK